MSPILAADQRSVSLGAEMSIHLYRKVLVQYRGLHRMQALCAWDDFSTPRSAHSRPHSIVISSLLLSALPQV